jgi:TatD DNase family protein
MHLSDAHCHLQDPRLKDTLTDTLRECRARGIQRWMVNATREADWAAVTTLANTEPGVHASYGLHPWWQAERSPHWACHLEMLLKQHPEAALGETGLDRWMKNPNIEDQIRVLEEHLELSRTLDRPITLHCLKAWPELAACLKRSPPSKKGFLLHSYAGPEAQIEGWIQAGAFFSLSPGFLHPRKAAQRAAFTKVPLERLLLETDAPDMPPPETLAILRFKREDSQHLNHPANLALCLDAVAADRGMRPEKLVLQVEKNASCAFGWV